MKLNLFILIMALFFPSCSNRKNSCDSNLTPVRNYNGYGVIRFQKNFTGSMRYMEFYPFCADKFINNNFDDIIKLDIKNGIVLRVTNSSELWQSLISNNNIKLDMDDYGLAIIVLKYHKNVKENKFINHFENYLIIKSRKVKVKMFDPKSYPVKVDAFKIIKGMNPDGADMSPRRREH